MSAAKPIHIFLIYSLLVAVVDCIYKQYVSVEKMLTLYFLQSSHAIRIAWLLEELGAEYELKFAERRPDKSAPLELGIPVSTGKSPAIQDGDLIIAESGAITE